MMCLRIVIASLLLVSLIQQPVHANTPYCKLELMWENTDIHHEYSAKGFCSTDQYIYTGEGGPKGKISKVDVRTGKTLWTYRHQSYQPSYPVSNGNVVVFGTYYPTLNEQLHGNYNYLIFLDDHDGSLRHKIPVDTVMSAVTFFGPNIFAGSNTGEFYCVRWKDGEIAWQKKLGHYFWSKPTIYEDLVITGSYDGFLYACDQETGEIAWKLDCEGAINFNAVLPNNLMAVVADGKRHSITGHDSTKTRKYFIILNLKQRQVVTMLKTESQWKYKVVIDSDDVLFFDSTRLFSFNTVSASLNWNYLAVGGLSPQPLLNNDTLLLAMNMLGHHGEYDTTTVFLNKESGKEIMRQTVGGIGIRSEKYLQVQDTVLVADGWLKSFSLNSTSNLP